LDPLWIHQFQNLGDILCGHGPKFGQLTKNLGSFLSQAWVDSLLRWRKNNDVESAYHSMYYKQIYDEDTRLMQDDYSYIRATNFE
jgi:hypothetical protein